MKYCVTGPRGIMAADMRLVEKVLKELVPEDVTVFSTGGAFGIDTHAAIEAQKLFPKAIHNLILPKESEFNRSLLELPGFNHYWVSAIGSRSDLLVRNDAMVELSEVLLAFPKTMTEEFRGSGTWACIRSARRVQIEIREFPLNGD